MQKAMLVCFDCHLPTNYFILFIRILCYSFVHFFLHRLFKVSFIFVFCIGLTLHHLLNLLRKGSVSLNVLWAVRNLVVTFIQGSFTHTISKRMNLEDYHCYIWFVVINNRTISLLSACRSHIRVWEG